jgi:DNA-3-methyladenine glycosylase
MAARCTTRFFAHDADEVARALLGCTLVRILEGRRIAGRIVECEAYMGAVDQASHARNNRRTARTEPMFGPPGRSYVYFTYGMHFCMNVSCKAKDDPQAVLIRALEPTEGLDLMRKHRGSAHPDIDLCRGPARLCRALAIGPPQNALDTPDSPELWFEKGRLKADEKVIASPRIGLGDKGDWTDKLLRFSIKGSKFVSAKKV